MRAAANPSRPRSRVAAAVIACPACKSPVSVFLGAGSSVPFRYYRCDPCGCVFALSKVDPGAVPIIIVTGRQ